MQADKPSDPDANAQDSPRWASSSRKRPVSIISRTVKRKEPYGITRLGSLLRDAKKGAK